MAKLRLHVFAVSFFRGENACAEWGEGCCGKMGWGLGTGRLRRNANAKGGAREGTFYIQPESLMLSGLR